MAAHARDLDDRRFGRKAGLARGGRERSGDLGRGRLADYTAALADQKYDEIARRMIVNAGNEGIATGNAMHEPMGAQKRERAVGRDGSKAPMFGREPLDDVVGAERLMAVEERGEHLAANGRKALALLRAARLREVHRIVEAPVVVVIRPGKDGTAGRRLGGFGKGHACYYRK